MKKAIATQLQSLGNIDTAIIELERAAPYWQELLGKAVINPSNSCCLVFPKTVAEIAAIIKQARQQQWRILICGNGSKLDWGGLSKDIQLVVSTQKCDRLIEHAIGDLTVTVEAGMKLVDLQALLRSHNQFLPIDPVYSETATMGGIVATADTGSWRQRYGGIRDMLLGLSFIRADGAIAKAGGRVVKNVAGYDLMKLFTGSYGTLGLISQLTFRTYPLPESSQTILLTGTPSAIAQATQTIRNSGLTPSTLDLVSASMVQQLALGNDIGLVVRFQTITPSVEQQSAQLEAIAQELNLAVSNYNNSDEISLWQRLSKTIRIPGTTSAIICKIGIAPHKAVDFLRQLPEIGVGNLAIIHGGSGIGYLQLVGEDIAVIAKMRSHCQQHQGFLTILTAPQPIKEQWDVWGYTGNALKTMQAIKDKFDPNHILNPGRFVGNI